MAVITVLVADGVPGHQLTIPGMVFTTAADIVGRTAYEVRIASVTGTVTTGEPALALTTPWGLRALDDADTVLVTGHDGFRAAPPPGVADALRGCAARGCRMAAIGTGAFTLAAAGLLDGRRALTSWPHTEELTRLHPGVLAASLGDPSVVDGPFHTAAGVMGGLDLCVDLVERDHGWRIAAEVARRIMLPLHDGVVADREEQEREIADRTSIEPTLRWLEARLHQPLTLAELAAHARISVSSLNRRFRAQTGLSPLQYLLRARLGEAQLLLENTDVPIEQIAARTGFGSPANLRHHFQRRTGTAPRAYRAACRALTARIAVRPPPAPATEG
ncbi:GlxA family transcriptional regulator [Streptomyces jumonjinensis]|uniref:Helix-turn-helix domain-containing protein n=1 Tax=Streptomyces jumonjinensis TaxID=1945 RepID=A0A646KPL4_STRJU|nr:helix-turn-helix domain-containing protein [Streptomyces jumonjinensis]MQT04040.1 helix-turn-helix domain-containing protein [Streptomyces jumonjinensis]